jgi:hypothetical protein
LLPSQRVEYRFSPTDPGFDGAEGLPDERFLVR